ncbi:Holliday junction resolvase RecU [Mycoplasma seminis]|uniref:Holliday junction resolvase RecU n=1 Tax=Mycoplasma seminis TaxID=512749 RepID=A0ABY9H9T3_9MOLU|nr:Holliday junction resolvase RecU [Mycoplasma seminis]WLP85340.1 Holliday junction resolvase RecU [Mycoplasma seminis]
MSSKNRGMFLESVINQSIKYYWENNIAFIEKKAVPTSFSDLKNISHNKFKASITLLKSTVDYIGMYQGKFVAFEAKSTNEKSLDLSNFRLHQLQYLSLINSQGGIAFVIVYFSLYNEFYKISVDFLNQEFKSKKSISYEKIKKNSSFLNLEFPGLLTIFS